MRVGRIALACCVTVGVASAGPVSDAAGPARRVVVGAPLASTARATPARTGTAAATTRQVVALVLRGTGFGHGRGLSQWGAYGWAVTHGWTWQQILAHYYGGTGPGLTAVTNRIGVRLLRNDGRATVGVISATGTAVWNGVTAPALYAHETAPDTYDVYRAETPTCPGNGSWTLVSSGVPGPIVFSTTTSETSGASGDVLGLCETDASVTHYRGTIELTHNSAGDRRVVNRVGIESYLRGVVPREVFASWGDSGGGAGMNALRAQAVAARSYALAVHVYTSSGSYADLCDTSACQVYGGAARRATATSPTQSGGVCETGNATFECDNSDRAVRDTAGVVRRWVAGGTGTVGQIVATEFSASNGPRTAGGRFPAVDDPGDDTPGNPNHRWTRVLDADVVAAQWGLGTLTGAVSERDPALGYDGVWDNRVRLTTASGSRTLADASFVTAFGLRSPGFTVTPVYRTLSSHNRLAMVGDSVGLGVADTTTSELRAQLAGEFASESFNNVQSRCISGCSLNASVALAAIPDNTAVVLLSLGYNDWGNPAAFASKIDAVMLAMRRKHVGRVLWMTLAERSASLGTAFARFNQELIAARARWYELTLLDWRAYSAGTSGNRSRWFSSDGIHPTSTGQAELAIFLRNASLYYGRVVPQGRAVSLVSSRATTGALEVRRAWWYRLSWPTVSTLPAGADLVAGGDYDANGAPNETLSYDRTTGRWVVHSWSNFVPALRTVGYFRTGYDRVLSGDLDGDGRRNEVFVWRRSTGRWVVYRFRGDRPTAIAGGIASTIYDEVAIGDFDSNGVARDLLFYDAATGRWSMRRVSGSHLATRASGTIHAGYTRLAAGDVDSDGKLDDLVVWDNSRRVLGVYEWSPSVRPKVRSSSVLSHGYDQLLVADLDADGRADDLFIRDSATGLYHTMRFVSWHPRRVITSTWMPGSTGVTVARLG